MSREVSELEGAELDYWAAKLMFPNDKVVRAEGNHVHVTDKDSGFCFESSWQWIGPIIEREKICLLDNIDEWVAGLSIPDKVSGSSFKYERGPTPLIAAMRCFVASKFGEKVGSDE